jgi:hypothetical protein
MQRCACSVFLSRTAHALQYEYYCEYEYVHSHCLGLHKISIIFRILQAGPGSSGKLGKVFHSSLKCICSTVNVYRVLHKTPSDAHVRGNTFGTIDRFGDGARGTPGITRILLYILYTKYLLCRVSQE